MALDCKVVNRVIVSTDNKNIKRVAEECGADVPFLRPKEISGDLSTDYEFIKHCLDYLKENGEDEPDIIVQLRPTYPTRKLEILNETLDIFIKNLDKYDSLRTVYEMEKSPYKMYNIKDGELKPLFKEVKGIKEPYNQCRQLLPRTYIHNGYIDLIKTEIVEKKGSITGDRIYPYLMSKEEYHDIDTEEDWKDAEKN